MVQGCLKNREFLNALALICQSEQLFNYLCCMDVERFDDKHLFLFRMFKNKFQRYTVAIDSKIPTLDDKQNTSVPCFCRTEISNEVWLPVIEKAYAKLLGGYYKMVGISLRDAI